jgi:hypothetical protein
VETAAVEPAGAAMETTGSAMKSAAGGAVTATAVTAARGGFSGCTRHSRRTGDHGRDGGNFQDFTHGLLYALIDSQTLKYVPFARVT